MTKSILLINGPNLNMLGTRQPEIYGSQTLADIENQCVAHAERLGISLSAFQSNFEGAIVEAIHDALGNKTHLIMNLGAYSHTSIAIHDAVSSVSIPAYEVHLSNIYARESFRHHSYLSGIAKAVICGMGTQGYIAAIDGIAAE